MKEFWNTIQLVFAAVGGWLGYFLGGCDGLLIALVIFVTCDYLTGIMCAIADKKLSSEVGFKGICRKVLIFILVGIANVIDINVLGQVGVLHGMKTYLLQDEIGNIQLAHSISAGLDYPGVGPEHAYLRDSGRAKYVSVTDKECMDALMELCRMEGIIPAIESAHALAHVFKMAQGEYKGKTIIMCLSGRGDKDVNTVQKYLNGEETNK